MVLTLLTICLLFTFIQILIELSSVSLQRSRLEEIKRDRTLPPFHIQNNSAITWDINGFMMTRRERAGKWEREMYREKERERERGSGNASFDEAKLKLVCNKLNFCHITLFALSLLCLQHYGACLIESTDISVIRCYPGSRARSQRAFVLLWARSEQQ